jgi:hypothetical protein
MGNFGFIAVVVAVTYFKESWIDGAAASEKKNRGDGDRRHCNMETNTAGGLRHGKHGIFLDCIPRTLGNPHSNPVKLIFRCGCVS